MSDWHITAKRSQRDSLFWVITLQEFLFLARNDSEVFFFCLFSLFLTPGRFTLSTPEPLEESISHTTTFQPVLTGMSCPCRLLGPSVSASFILSESLMVHFPMDIWHAFPSSVHLSMSLLSFFFFFFTQYNRHWISLWLNAGKYRYGTALILWNRIHEVIFFLFVDAFGAVNHVVLPNNGSC